MIVRCGAGYTFRRMRIASIMISVPVPLSVAPDAPSHESKCAERITYSPPRAAPGMVAMVLFAGCVSRNREDATIRTRGRSPAAASRYSSE